MTGRTHSAIGAACGAALSLAGAPLLPSLIAGGLGALLPDCDVPGSRGTRMLATLGVGALLGGTVLSALAPVGAWSLVLLAVMLVAGALTGHRAATHSLLVAVLVAVAAAYLRVPALGVGYASHLLADAVTPEGIALLWPWRGERIRHPLVTTGGPGDLLVGMAAWAAAGMIMFHSR